MAENATIARLYAEAAFAIADAGGTLARWAQALDVMAEIATHPEVRAAIGNPRLTDEQLSGLFASLTGDALADDVQQFVRSLYSDNFEKDAIVIDVRVNVSAPPLTDGSISW